MQRGMRSLGASLTTSRYLKTKPSNFGAKTSKGIGTELEEAGQERKLDESNSENIFLGF